MRDWLVPLFLGVIIGALMFLSFQLGRIAGALEIFVAMAREGTK